MKYIIIFFLLACAGCQQHNRITKIFDGYSVNTFWYNDSVPDGEAVYFDKAGFKYSIQHYSNGLKNGPCVYFHKNSLVADSVNYTNNLLDGYHYQYDYNGSLKLKNYFIRGFRVGPKMLFDKGRLSSFEFMTFEQESPFFCIYGPGEDSLYVEGRPYFISLYQVKSASDSNGVGIFAYLVHAPKILCDFSLIRKHTDSSDYTLIRSYASNEFLIDTSLQRKPQEKIYLKTYYKDSINKKEQVYMTELN